MSLEDACSAVVSSPWCGTAMRQSRASLEAAFMLLCRKHGPDWIESIIRPLRLPGKFVSVKDIPIAALSAAVDVFGGVKSPAA
jgi:hypothetical protein